MKLGPWELSRRTQAVPAVGDAGPPAGTASIRRIYGAAPQGDVQGPRAGAVGSPDIQLYAGMMDDVEQTPELRGRGRYRIYDAMRASDTAVKALLWAVKLPIRAAEWRVEPASDDPVDLLVADCCEWLLGLAEEDGRMVGGLDELLRLILLQLDYGSFTGELEWGEVESWTDSEGDDHLVRPLIRVGRRLPHTIVQYGAPTTTNDPLSYVEQDMPKMATIPGNKLVHATLEGEVEPYRGVSLLRACYGPWNLKRSLIVSSAIGYDRYAAGVPMVRYPADTGERGRGIAMDIGRNLRVNERAYIALPGSAEEGWNVEILSGAGSLADPVPLLRHYDALIMLSGLAQFSQLGTSERGSRAVGEVLADPFYQALTTLAGAIATTITQQVLGRFVLVTFGEVDMPKLRVANIQHRNIPVLFGALANASTAGMSFADLETQNVLRTILGLPELAAMEAPEGAEPGDATGEQPPGGNGYPSSPAGPSPPGARLTRPRGTTGLRQPPIPVPSSNGSGGTGIP